MKKIFILIMTFLITNIVLAAQYQTTLVYKARGGSKEEFFQTYILEKLTDGYLVKIKFTEKGELNREHEVTLNSKFETIKWKFHSPVTGLSIDAHKKDDAVILTGTKKGKIIEKKFELKNKPWMQIFPTGLEVFSLSLNKSIEFWSIGVEGPAEMKIGEFIAKHKGTENLTLADTKIAAAEVLTLSFNDWKSALWTGKSWHRKTDGRVLAIYVGRDIGTWELVSEKN